MSQKITSLFRGTNRRALLLGVFALCFASLAVSVQAGSAIIGAPEAYQQAKAGEIILVDIRTPQEWRQTGVGQGAIGLDMSAPDFVESLVKLRQSYPAKPIALICRTGNRSGYVFDALEQQGFPGLQNVAEGMAGGPNGKGWLKRGLPVYKGTLANIKKRLGKVLK